MGHPVSGLLFGLRCSLFARLGGLLFPLPSYLFPCLGEELGDLFRLRFALEGDGGVVFGGGQLFEKGGEFELGEESAAGGVVDGLGAHGVERELDGDGGMDGDEFFREEDVVAVVLEGFAVGFLLNLIGEVERGFDGAELLDELDGTLVADAGGARDVVDGVAAQGHDVDHPGWWDPQGVFDPLRTEDEVVFGGVEDGDVLVDELHHVFVGADDVDVVAHGAELAGERADDVVGFVALVVEDGDAEGFEGAADVGLLLDEVGPGFRRGWPCSRRTR